MNRRDFFTRIVAAAAVPSLLPAAKAEPAAQPTKPPGVPEAGYAWLPYHPHPAPKVAPRSLDELAKLVQGGHSLRLRAAYQLRGEAYFEFEVLQSCTYEPPAGLTVHLLNSALLMGDTFPTLVDVSSFDLGQRCGVIERGVRCCGRATSRFWDAPKEHPYDEVWICDCHVEQLVTKGTVCWPIGADALAVLNRASNEIYRLAPKVIGVVPLNLP